MENIPNPDWMHGKYQHIRIPKKLIADPIYKWMLPEAKYLYGLLMDRTSLSATKGTQFKNEKGETYIYFSLTELQDLLSCGHDKASKVMGQLVKAGLVKRRRIGVGRPYEIVVVPMDWTMRKLRSDTSIFPQPGSGKIRTPVRRKSEENNPYRSEPDGNHESWVERLIAACMHRDDLERYYPKDLVDRLADAMAVPFYVNTMEYRVGEVDMDVGFLRVMMQSLDQEQLSTALRIMQTKNAGQMNTSDILGILCDLYRAPLDV